MKEKAILKKEKQTRNSYSLETKATAKRYYLIGLNLNEISKLVDAPVRTIEKWQISENWRDQRETTEIQKKAYELFTSGKKYKEIAKILNLSTATIWRYLKKVKNNETIN
jgi:transposase